MFQKVPLSQENLRKETWAESIALALKSAKIWLILLPVILLLIAFSSFFNFSVGEALRRLSPLLMILLFAVVIDLSFHKLEAYLRFKKVGKLEVWFKIDLFFILIFVFKNHQPIVLAPQRDTFSEVKSGDTLHVEKSALNRVLVVKKLVVKS